MLFVYEVCIYFDRHSVSLFSPKSLYTYRKRCSRLLCVVCVLTASPFSLQNLMPYIIFVSKTANEMSIKCSINLVIHILCDTLSNIFIVIVYFAIEFIPQIML